MIYRITSKISRPQAMHTKDAYHFFSTSNISDIGVLQVYAYRWDYIYYEEYFLTGVKLSRPASLMKTYNCDFLAERSVLRFRQSDRAMDRAEHAVSFRNIGITILLYEGILAISSVHIFFCTVCKLCRVHLCKL